MRVHRASTFVQRVHRGHFTEAAEVFFEGAHPGYIVMAIPGAIVQQIFNEGTLGVHLAAALLGLYSVAEILVMYGIARKGGAGEPEALLATFLMACATTLFYFARHFLPYDASMLLALLGLWVSLGARSSWWRLMLSGFLLLATIIVYTGSWMLVAIVGLLLVIGFVSGTWRQQIIEMVRRVVFLGLGAGVILGGVALYALLSGIDLMGYLHHAAAFSGTINEGSYLEGWLLTWKYFWHAEHFLVILWLAGCALALLRVRRTHELRGIYWMLGLLLLYGLMAGTSSILTKFVMYGRLVRELTPFLVLAASYGIAPYLVRSAEKRPMLKYAFVIVVLIQTAVNFYQPLVQRFPNDVLAPSVAQYQDITLASTIMLEKDTPANLNPQARYYLVNMVNLWWMPLSSIPVPDGTVVFSTPHPFAYKPYQYEGYSDRQRDVLDNANINMMVIDRGEDAN